ncbi:hypothetical protein N665_0040s0037 [Sinapis alba]|nr:hypothetical protein N665_0040s0037 [Sinapis alba]
MNALLEGYLRHFVAYRLVLSPQSKIHQVFHISQLKLVMGQPELTILLPHVLDSDEDLVIEPEEVLDSRYDEEGHLEVLIKWCNLPDHETFWL